MQHFQYERWRRRRIEEQMDRSYNFATFLGLIIFSYFGWCFNFSECASSRSCSICFSWSNIINFYCKFNSVATRKPDEHWTVFFIKCDDSPSCTKKTSSDLLRSWSSLRRSRKSWCRQSSRRMRIASWVLWGGLKKTWRKFSMPNALPINAFLHSGQSGFLIFDLIMLVLKWEKKNHWTLTMYYGRGESES